MRQGEWHVVPNEFMVPFDQLVPGQSFVLVDMVRKLADPNMRRDQLRPEDGRHGLVVFVKKDSQKAYPMGNEWDQDQWFLFRDELCMRIAALSALKRRT